MIRVQCYVAWLAIRYLVRLQNLTVFTVKVTAHANDTWNNQVDRLAKSGGRADSFDFDFTSFTNQGLISWNNILLESSVRSTLKAMSQAQQFLDYLQYNRNTRINLCLSQIDWEATWHYINYHPIDNVDAFRISSDQAFKFKCINQDLPVIEKLKLRRPDLYNCEHWTCVYCDRLETFDHLWTCSNIAHNLHILIEDCIHYLKKHIAPHTDLVKELILSKLRDLTVWRLDATYGQLRFSDLMKGVVPMELLQGIINCGLSRKVALIICLDFMYHLMKVMYNKVWKIRCENVIEKELSLGITAHL